MKRYYFKNLHGHYVVSVSNTERQFDSIRRAKQFAKKYGEEVYTWDYWGAKSTKSRNAVSMFLLILRERDIILPRSHQFFYNKGILYF